MPSSKFSYRPVLKGRYWEKPNLSEILKNLKFRKFCRLRKRLFDHDYNKVYKLLD